MDNDAMLAAARWVNDVLQRLELEEIQQQAASLKALYTLVLPGQQEPPRVVTPATFKDEYTKGYRKVLTPLRIVVPGPHAAPAGPDTSLTSLDDSPTRLDADKQAVLREVYGLMAAADWEPLTTIRALTLHLAGLHKAWANALWSSLLVPDNWRCAYHYEAAGYLQRELGDYHHSGQLYHFAGNKFRSVQAWERAADTYLASAKIAANGKDQRSMPLALRSARRAIYCFGQVEERGDMATTEKLLAELINGELPRIPED